MVQVHHAAVRFAPRRRADEQVFGDLDLRWPKQHADLIALRAGEYISALYHDDLARTDAFPSKETAPVVLLRFSTLGENRSV
jgi:hypothetical protein